MGRLSSFRDRIKRVREHKKKCLIFLIILICAVILTVSLVVSLTTVSEKAQEPSPTAFAGASTTLMQQASPTQLTTTVKKEENTTEERYRSAALSSGASADCTNVGKEILQRHGGSAVDAAIAIAICSGLHHPERAGIGGGSLMTVFNQTSRQDEVLNFLSSAPANSTINMFLANSSLASYGGLSAAIAGEVAGYRMAWQRYGKVSWSTLFNATIDMCWHGVPVNKETARAIRDAAEHLRESEAFRDEFFRNGLPLAENETLRRDRLCKTLQSISDSPESFYRGPLAHDIIEDIGAAGGNWMASDLKEYSVHLVPLVKFLIGSSLLMTPPPPSLGALVGYVLKILNGYSFQPSSRLTSEMYHRVVESFKFAFMMRRHFGDVVDKKFVEELRSHELTSAVRSRIRGDTTYNHSSFYNTLPVPPGEEFVWTNGGGSVSLLELDHFSNKEDSGSLHTSVVDSSGFVVSMTSTLNSKFGSKRMGNRTGIIFNNAMADFSWVSSGHGAGANQIEPRKRPASFMCPSIILDGNNMAQLVVGAVGGPKTITATVWTILNNLMLNETLADSVSAPRLHHQLLPDILYYEEKFNKVYIDELVRRRHRTGSLGSRAGYVHALSKDEDGYWTPSSDQPGSRTGY